jgi:8-oxo-dGTP pyrophosphatase MutT (NUDIX family)
MTQGARFFYRDPAAPRPQRRQVGALAIIERERTVLVERRSDSGLWAFIGGRVNDDEDVMSALHREVHEETGLTLGSVAFFGVFSDPTRIIAYADGNVVRLLTLVFRATAHDTAEPRASDESLELRFVFAPELASLDLVATHRPIRDRYLAGEPSPVID